MSKSKTNDDEKQSKAEGKDKIEKEEESSSEDEETSEEKTTKTVTPTKQPIKKDADDEDEDEDEDKDEGSEVPKPGNKGEKDEESSSYESGSDEEDAPKDDKKRKASEMGATSPEAKKRKISDTDSVPSGSTSTGEEGMTKVFLGNLPFSVEEETIREVFKDVGEILSFDWHYDRPSGKFMGRGTIEFATPAEAQNALAHHDHEILGRKMLVKISRPREGFADRGGRGDRGRVRGGSNGGSRGPSEKPEGCDTVFLGNLSQSISEDDVRKTFGKCGTVVAVRWIERYGEFKGAGFCQFAEPDATDKAVALNGTQIKGLPVRVDFAQSKSRFSNE